jgi:chitinase
LTATATATGATPTPTPNNSALPKRLLIGYWHNFNNGSGFIKLRDVSPDWDIVHLAFGEPPGGTGSTIQFIPDAATSEAELKSDVAILHSRGKKVCLSIGGQNGHVELPTTADRDAFVSSVTAILNNYNLDGLDIDFEGGSVHMNGAESITSPTSGVIVNLISAIRTIRTNTRGANFVLTMAPETFYVQMGYYSYGGNGGAYLPVIYGTRDILTVLHVQQYNSGPIMGLDDQWHTMPAIDFHVQMAKMAISGFPCPKGSSNVFPGVRPDQYAMGLPANVNAGNGYTSEADVHTAFDQVRATYPGLRGLMAWSINWDAFNNFVFSTSHRAYLNGLP